MKKLCLFFIILLFISACGTTEPIEVTIICVQRTVKPGGVEEVWVGDPWFKPIKGDVKVTYKTLVQAKDGRTDYTNRLLGQPGTVIKGYWLQGCFDKAANGFHIRW